MKEKNTALLLSQAKGDTIGFCLEKICLNPKGFDERLYNSEPKILIDISVKKIHD